MKNLVIVESPAKAKTIEKFLGTDYTVKSSYGHIRDLYAKQMSIDLDNNYEPQYTITEDKKKLVSELQKAVKEADKVWLASDEDREGEAIAWHLQETLHLNPETTQRIVFNEITRTAILNAIEHPRSIDMDLVDAQQARRVLDRIVGYELSPILWSKIKAQLSAGRVQSVAVRLIVEREQEIKDFVSESYFKVTAQFHAGDVKQPIAAELTKTFKEEAEAYKFLSDIAHAQFVVSKVETKPAHRTPAPPFTTSTLQQEASRKLGYGVSRTMQIAQQLYEEGYITYMRTDSVNLSEMALQMAQEEVTQLYGKKYSQVRRYHTKIKGAQEAHEAIRPTSMANSTIEADTSQRRLYELIWKRTIASQMADAELEKTTIEIDIEGSENHFQCNGTRVVFDGFLKVYMESSDDDNGERDDEKMLPNIATGTHLQLSVATASQHHTQHPPRYTEASLVKKMEDLGIGRPSTYAPTISNILKRDYVIKEDRDPVQIDTTVITLHDGKIDTTIRKENTGAEKGKLFPTDTGKLVVHFLMEHFNEIMDFNFTANVEKDFDEIAEGRQEWRKVIDNFYVPFHKTVSYTQQNSQRSNGSRLIGVDPASKKNVYAKIGRYGAIVQIGDTSSDEKPRFASLRKGQSIETISLEEALELFSLPRTLGVFEDQEVVVSTGRFGPYVRLGSKFYSLGKTDDPLTVTLERCIEIITVKRAEEEAKEEMRKMFPHEIGLHEGEMIQSNSGRFGPYLMYKGSNYRLPKGTDPLKITIEEAVEIISASGEKKSKTRGGRKASTK
ncbi:MAG: type I DNA topoisomerase [Bacteroidales bacterium]|nr:type I DNA topoisomerase [Bacteroidales bacterium]